MDDNNLPRTLNGERTPEENDAIFNELILSLKELKDVEEELIETSDYQGSSMETVIDKFETYVAKIIDRLDRLIPADIQGEERAEQRGGLLNTFMNRKDNLENIVEKMASLIGEELKDNTRLLAEVLQRNTKFGNAILKESVTQFDIKEDDVPEIVGPPTRATVESRISSEKSAVESSKESKLESKVEKEKLEKADDIVSWLKKINESIQNLELKSGDGSSAQSGGALIKGFKQTMGNIGQRLKSPFVSGVNAMLSPFDAMSKAFDKIAAIPMKLVDWGKNKVKKALGTGGVSEEEFYAKGVKYFDKSLKLLESIAKQTGSLEKEAKSDNLIAKEASIEANDVDKEEKQYNTPAVTNKPEKKESIFDGILKGLSGMFRKLFSAAGPIIGVITAAIGGWKLGEWLYEKFADPIQSAIESTVNFFNDSWQKYVMEPIQVGLALISDWWTDSVSNPIGEALNDIGNWINDKLVNPFIKFFNMIADSSIGKMLGLEKSELKSSNTKFEKKEAGATKTALQEQRVAEKIRNGEPLNAAEEKVAGKLLDEGKITANQYLDKKTESSVTPTNISQTTEPKPNTSATAITTQSKATEQATQQKQLEQQKEAAKAAGQSVAVANNNVTNNTSQTFMRVEPRNNDISYSSFLGNRARFNGLMV